MSVPTALREGGPPLDDDEALVRAAERVVYKTTPQGELALFVFRPARDERPLPAIVYFTGGGWKNGEPHHMAANAAWFARVGIVGIAADYRVRSRHGTSPIECVTDARSAMRFVRANAASLGVDADRIVGAGGSAGGHIAACCAYDCGVDDAGEDRAISPRPSALVLHNPVTGGPGFSADFFAEHPNVAPVAHVTPGWPPTILSCGTDDEVTPYVDAVAFAERVASVGSDVELVTIPAAAHSCDWPASNPHFEPTMRRMAAFLRRHDLM